MKKRYPSIDDLVQFLWKKGEWVTDEIDKIKKDVTDIANSLLHSARRNKEANDLDGLIEDVEFYAGCLIDKDEDTPGMLERQAKFTRILKTTCYDYVVTNNDYFWKDRCGVGKSGFFKVAIDLEKKQAVWWNHDDVYASDNAGEWMDEFIEMAEAHKKGQKEAMEEFKEYIDKKYGKERQ